MADKSSGRIQGRCEAPPNRQKSKAAATTIAPPQQLAAERCRLIKALNALRAPIDAGASRASGRRRRAHVLPVSSKSYPPGRGKGLERVLAGSSGRLGALPPPREKMPSADRRRALRRIPPPRSSTMRESGADCVRRKKRRRPLPPKPFQRSLKRRASSRAVWSRGTGCCWDDKHCRKAPPAA